MDISNEKQQNEPFYMYRKVSKCLSAGISLLTNNFTHIVKLTLPVSLVYSAIAALLIFLLSDSRLLLATSIISPTEQNNMLLNYVMVFLLSILLLAVSCLFVGVICRCIVVNSHNLSLKNIRILPTYKIAAKYGLKYFCFLMFLMVIGTLMGFMIASPLFITTEGTVMLFVKIAFMILLMAVCIILCLPFKISLPAMFLCKGKAVKSICNGYRKGIKKIGKIFCLSILIGMLCFFIMTVLAFPSIIMVNSYYSATLSQLNGDIVTMPSGFGIWYYLILLITCYLFTFTLWINIVPFAYLYASIRSDEKEEEKNSYLKTKFK